MTVKVHGGSRDVTIASTPIYICPHCGEITELFSSNIPGHEGHWCLACYVDWVAQHVPRVFPKPEK